MENVRAKPPKTFTNGLPNKMRINYRQVRRSVGLYPHKLFSAFFSPQRALSKAQKRHFL